jgi:hypothetical protein
MGYTSVLLSVLMGPTLAAGQDDRAAPPRDGLYRLDVYQGPFRSVQYVTKGRPPADEAAAREQARAENSAYLADEVDALKRQYVRGEMLLDAGRRPVQSSLYGVSTDYSSASYLGYGYGPGGYNGYYGALAPYGYALGGYGYGYGGYVAGSANVSRGLEHGVGDEGPIKRDLAQVIAGESGPGTSGRAYTSTGRRNGVEPVAHGDEPRQATLTLKDGKEIKGLLLSSSAEWFVLRDGKADVWVRSSEVLRMRLEEASNVKPAVDK